MSAAPPLFNKQPISERKSDIVRLIVVALLIVGAISLVGVVQGGSSASPQSGGSGGSSASPQGDSQVHYTTDPALCDRPGWTCTPPTPLVDSVHSTTDANPADCADPSNYVDQSDACYAADQAAGK
jgi:hypothetical protein